MRQKIGSDLMVVIVAAADTIGTWPLPRFSLAAGALGGTVAAAVGVRAYALLPWLFAMLFLDLVAGAVAALRKGRFEGAILAGGLLGKLLRLLLVPVAVGVERVYTALGLSTGQAHPLVLLVIAALIVGEAASIVRNVIKSEGKVLGASILARVLQQLGRDMRKEGRRA